MKKGLWKDALVLFVITLLSAAILACVYALTEAPIEKAEKEAKQASYEAVFAGARFEAVPENELSLAALNEVLASGEAENGGVSLKRASVTELLRAVDADGTPLGYVVCALSKSGYGGEITATVGITNEGEMCGFTVLSHSETAGFGARCDEPEYQKTFVGDRSAADVDMISGATYSTTALQEICGAAFYAVDAAESGVSADA